MQLLSDARERLATALGLRYSADLRTLAAIFLYFSSTAFAWIYGDRLSWPAYLALWFCVSWLSLTGAIMTHNTMHVAIFKSRAANKVVHVLLSMTYGHPVSSFVPGHNLSHHQYTQTTKDYMRSSKVRFNWHLLNVLLFQPLVAGDVLKSDVRFLNMQRELQRPFFWRCMQELSLLMTMNVWLVFLNWRKFIALWFVPHFIAQYGIVTINFLQHDGCDIGEQEDENQLLTARNFTGPILNMLLFNNGFHTMHHLKPHMHWSELPAAHDKVVAPRIDPRLNEPSFWPFFFRTFIFPGRRLTFRGEPVVFSGPEPADEPWLAVPPTISASKVEPTLSNFLENIRVALPVALLLPFKVFAPLYSPVHKLE